ncbi:hypothetical protein ABG752_11540 [Streptococcus iniae]
MGKRMVETDFWQDEKVIEQFSPEDKYFMMYLLTNPKVTSIGIYKFRKKVVAFELGYTLDSVKVLLDRFENKYQMIKYNDSTQEIAVLNCLKYTINKGGKPIESMVDREIKNIDDGGLILATYNRMIDWWGSQIEELTRVSSYYLKKNFLKEKYQKKIILILILILLLILIPIRGRIAPRFVKMKKKKAKILFARFRKPLGSHF